MVGPRQGVGICGSSGWEAGSPQTQLHVTVKLNLKHKCSVSSLDVAVSHRGMSWLSLVKFNLSGRIGGI